MPFGQPVCRDLAGVGVHAYVQFAPSPTCPAVLGCVPFALAEELEAGTVQNQVHRAVVGTAARLSAGERAPTPAERRMVRHPQLEPKQLQHAPGKRLRLAQGELDTSRSVSTSSIA